jgi:hypothetical protein
MFDSSVRSKVSFIDFLNIIDMCGNHLCSNHLTRLCAASTACYESNLLIMVRTLR